MEMSLGATRYGIDEFGPKVIPNAAGTIYRSFFKNILVASIKGKAIQTNKTELEKMRPQLPPKKFL